MSTDTRTTEDLLERIDEGIDFFTRLDDMPFGRRAGFAHEVKRATGWNIDICDRYVTARMAETAR